jgi:hypothetical protein
VEGSAGGVGISKCGKKSPLPEEKSPENKKGDGSQKRRAAKRKKQGERGFEV